MGITKNTCKLHSYYRKEYQLNQVNILKTICYVCISLQYKNIQKENVSGVMNILPYPNYAIDINYFSSDDSSTRA